VLDSKHEPSTVSLRPLERRDFKLLIEWINMPHVALWWDGKADMESVVAKYEPRLQHDSLTSVYVIQLNDRPIGIIQCYRHKDYPEWERAVGIEQAAGIDYLIGASDCMGKGIGSSAIRAIKNIAFNIYSDVEVIVSVPQKENQASWRALEKAGFERIDERKLDSDCPSDSGVSYIYVCLLA
jgi:aminoglycoside 6'-N-acetyltransferase